MRDFRHLALWGLGLLLASNLGAQSRFALSETDLSWEMEVNEPNTYHIIQIISLTGQNFDLGYEAYPSQPFPSPWVWTVAHDPDFGFHGRNTGSFKLLGDTLYPSLFFLNYSTANHLDSGEVRVKFYPLDHPEDSAWVSFRLRTVLPASLSPLNEATPLPYLRQGILHCPAALEGQDLRLWSLQGQLLWQGRAEQFQVLPLLSSGIYILQSPQKTWPLRAD